MLRFTSKFILFAALLLIPISLIPESSYNSLNRITDYFVGELLLLFSVDTRVRGTHLTMNGFTVRVIAECSSIHLVALFGAFIIAFPAPAKKKWTGFVAGAVTLFVLNAFRIALVTLVGSFYPGMFEICHVYFGQLVMMAVTVAVCLVWCRWCADSGGIDGAMGFCIRFLLFTSVPFLIWIPMNRPLMGAVDQVVKWAFQLAGHHLVFPRMHVLYYQTFSLIALFGFLMAVKGASLAQRLRWRIGSAVVSSALLVAIRLCNVWITAFRIEWIEPISQSIYNTCVYGFPFVIGLRFLVKTRRQQSEIITAHQGSAVS